jgi:hypothetical protein
MKLRASPSLLSAIGLCRRFIAAANHGKIGEPESLARSHRIRLDDARSRPQRSPAGDWTLDCVIPEYNLHSSGVYTPGRKPKGIRRRWRDSVYRACVSEPLRRHE